MQTSRSWVIRAFIVAAMSAPAACSESASSAPADGGAAACRETLTARPDGIAGRPARACATAWWGTTAGRANGATCVAAAWRATRGPRPGCWRHAGRRGAADGRRGARRGARGRRRRGVRPDGAADPGDADRGGHLRDDRAGRVPGSFSHQGIYGVDLVVPSGTRLVAPASGRVVGVRNSVPDSCHYASYTTRQPRADGACPNSPTDYGNYVAIAPSLTRRCRASSSPTCATGARPCASTTSSSPGRRSAPPGTPASRRTPTSTSPA